MGLVKSDMATWLIRRYSEYYLEILTVNHANNRKLANELREIEKKRNPTENVWVEKWVI